jgi:hypothetical protein
VGSRRLLSDEARLGRMIMLGTGNFMDLARLHTPHVLGIVKTTKWGPTFKNNDTTGVPYPSS